MPEIPRRRFLKTAFLASGGALLEAEPATTESKTKPSGAAHLSLDGIWQFRLDPENAGEAAGWYREAGATGSWQNVKVPHTWQIDAPNAEYMGIAWYRRTFDVPQQWSGQHVRIEFEAVFHTATVWLNGIEIGRHVGKGYTAFALDMEPNLHPGHANEVVVRADNSFNESMLPRGRSSDWAHDGGIYRSVGLLVTPAVFIERVTVDAIPDVNAKTASVQTTAVIRNTSKAAWMGQLQVQVVDEGTGLPVPNSTAATPVQLSQGERKQVTLPSTTIQDAKLWHFDHPHLYELSVTLSSGHALTTIFGVRKIETRDNKFYLNGEPVRLMGVERMAGSNPRYGMAEPAEWIEHDHGDLKDLNCVYTRVHWPQDRRVLDWCDRNGILIQTEVPTWGPATFRAMTDQPSPEIMNNGLEQLREMIERDRNHPCIFSWGVCNEIGGQNPPAYAFAKRMYEEAKRLDPNRLVSYASHSLRKTPGKDVAGLMDYVMFNEYYGSWYPGTGEDLARNLDEIHQAFPDKAIVISEYGYCACTADRPEGDAARIAVLREHDEVFRQRDFIAGLIFFCYNDYRTHVGDRGTGVCKQRVHGVVDLYGEPKASWEVLRRQSSPVEMRVSGKPPTLVVSIVVRSTVPAYTLRGYEVRGVAYGFGEIPVEEVLVPLQDLQPGSSANVELTLATREPLKVAIDLLRPTGYSAGHEIWTY